MRFPWQSEEAHLSRLAKAAQRGDREAFRGLYRALYPGVSRFVARRIREQADAEDLVSRTFERFLERLATLDPERGVVGFTLAIARNAVADHARQRRPEGSLDGAADLAASEADPLGVVLEGEALSRLARALAGQSAEVRELVALRFGDGLRHKEIAALLGLTEDAVRQRLSRALKELRAVLAGNEGGLAHEA